MDCAVCALVKQTQSWRKKETHLNKHNNTEQLQKDHILDQRISET